jgi:hypothetical protein
MRKGTVVGLLVCLLLLATAISAGAITWGELDYDHHYVGAMIIDYTDIGRPDIGLWQTCSGTLIHPRVFLTAGHCTADLTADEAANLYVNFNADALNPDTLRKVETAVTHPDYLWEGSNPHDLAALILVDPVVDIEPAALPTEGFLDDLKVAGLLRDKMDGALFTLVGYGGILEWPPPEISYDDQRRVSYSEYRSLEPVWLHMSQNAHQDNGGTCFGDSGGPAFWVDPDDGSETLLGVTSWGDGNCLATSFNYRVDIPDSISFIESVIPAE